MEKTSTTQVESLDMDINHAYTVPAGVKKQNNRNILKGFVC